MPNARYALLIANGQYTLTQAEGMLANTPEIFEALDVKALAGLEEMDDARAINSEPGVAQCRVRLLGQLEGVEKFW